jgi:hypothetical protein
MMAEMVYHYIADDTDVYDGIPPELAEEDAERALRCSGLLERLTVFFKEVEMGLTRRDFLKTSIAASTAATVGMPLAKEAEAAVKGRRGGLAVGQVGVPLLRHRLRHHGGYPGRQDRRHQGRPGRAGEPRSELRQRLLQRQDSSTAPTV